MTYGWTREGLGPLEGAGLEGGLVLFRVLD